MVSFSQLPAVKKDTIFVAARKIFGLSYFVTALAIGDSRRTQIKKIQTHIKFRIMNKKSKLAGKNAQIREQMLGGTFL